MDFQMFKLDLEKAEEPERGQIANIRWIIKKAREFQKNIYFCLIDYAMQGAQVQPLVGELRSHMPQSS